MSKLFDAQQCADVLSSITYLREAVTAVPGHKSPVVGVTSMVLLLHMRVSELRHQQAHVSDVADLLCTSRQSVHHSLRSLERDGLADAKAVTLTDLGRNIFTSIEGDRDVE